MSASNDRPKRIDKDHERQLTEPEQKRLNEIIEEIGLEATAKRFNVAVGTIRTTRRGGEAQRATITMIRIGLKEKK